MCKGGGGSTNHSDQELKLEFLKKLADLEGTSVELIGLIDNTSKEFKSGNLSTESGVSLLYLKSQLMLRYLTDLTYIIAIKCNGESIEGDPAIERLVENSTILERIRPLEQKIRYMIDKLAKISVTGVTNENDPTQFRANPDSMMDNMNDSSDSEEDKETAPGKKSEKKEGVYVPPKLAPMHYDEEESVESRRRQQLERAKRRALHSSVVGELREQYLDTPTEENHGNALRITESRKQRLKSKYEEEYMTRLPTSKKDKHRGRHSMALGNIADQLTYFEDIQVLEDEGALGRTSKRSRKPTKNKGTKRRRTR